MPEETDQNATTAIVATICSLISAIVASLATKLPDWLKYRSAASVEARQTKKDADTAVRKARKEDNDILAQNYATMLNRMQDECNRLLVRANERQEEFDRQNEKIEELRASHMKCIEEHAETKGELRAIMLRIGLMDEARRIKESEEPR